MVKCYPINNIFQRRTECNTLIKLRKYVVLPGRTNYGPSPIPQEGTWTWAKGVGDINGFTHGVLQGACKLTLNIKNGVIEEALIGTGNNPMVDASVPIAVAL